MCLSGSYILLVEGVFHAAVTNSSIISDQAQAILLFQCAQSMFGAVASPSDLLTSEISSRRPAREALPLSVVTLLEMAVQSTSTGAHRRTAIDPLNADNIVRSKQWRVETTGSHDAKVNQSS